MAPEGNPVPPGPLLAGLGATTCMALATILVRRAPTADPVAMNTIAALTAAGLLVGATLISGLTPVLAKQADTWTAVLYLAVIGSVAVFTLQLLVLKHWPASRANYVFVLIPPVDLDPAGGNVLLRVAGIGEELSALLGVKVDVVTDVLLRDQVAASAHADAVPL